MCLILISIQFFNDMNTATKNNKNALFFLSYNGNGAKRLCVMRPARSPPPNNNGALLRLTRCEPATTVRCCRYRDSSPPSSFDPDGPLVPCTATTCQREGGSVSPVINCIAWNSAW